MRCEFINDAKDRLRTVQNFHDLAALLGLAAGHLSHVYRNRHAMQHRIRLNGRTVFRSDPSLRRIQQRIALLLTPLFDGLPDTDCALAYRAGRRAVDSLRDLAGAHTLITLDVRRYYDNVTFPLLASCLESMGLHRLGARLVASYCVVHTGAGSGTLQQGSPASPVLSNIVGHHCLDVPIRAWLAGEHPEVACDYVRYCDNLALFVRDAPPEGFTEAFKEQVKGVFRASGLTAHKWNTVSRSHPSMNQRFLGVVLNAEARCALDHVDRLRAILFNWAARMNTRRVLRLFMDSLGVDAPYDLMDVENLWLEKFKKHMLGHINYIRGVNIRQGRMLAKLFSVGALFGDCELADGAPGMPQTLLEGRAEIGPGVPPEFLSLVKRYRLHEESEEAYLEKIRHWLQQAA